ncbi:hypothetical protein MHBO_004239 [Bonamia ostreae]|uniref:Uncharacterized protein n=1 Tax=Bonamia ostreae TaxID=126728 RepID=A0ABV2ASS0_9EUKA
MRSKNLTEPDLLIRTSGENRLSDFLLWQINRKTKIVFADKFWPEFTNFDLLKILTKFYF